LETSKRARVCKRFERNFQDILLLVAARAVMIYLTMPFANS
jgi:hypothetical protein